MAAAFVSSSVNATCGTRMLAAVVFVASIALAGGAQRHTGLKVPTCACTARASVALAALGTMSTPAHADWRRPRAQNSIWPPAWRWLGDAGVRGWGARRLPRYRGVGRWRCHHAACRGALMGLAERRGAQLAPGRNLRRVQGTLTHHSKVSPCRHALPCVQRRHKRTKRHGQTPAACRAAAPRR
jgi:hypothetical protein